MSTAVATKSEPTIAAPSRKMPVIDPTQVYLDIAGLARSHWKIRLPEGCIADDLKEPDAWKRVQATHGKAMRVHDNVYLVAFDETWSAEAIVSEADATSVTLAGFRIINTPRRTRTLMRDSNFAIDWAGSGYRVRRLADGQWMSGIVATVELAERDLRNLYSVPVSAQTWG